MVPHAQDGAGTPAISRLGNRLAYSVGRSDANIWRVDLRGPDRKPGVPFKFISSTRSDMDAIFSPDGKRIAFLSARSGDGRIWVCDRDASNPVQLNASPVQMDWSPDSQSIVYPSAVGDNQDIYTISANDEAAPQRLTDDPVPKTWPFWSRDGKSIYFLKSDRSGTGQIWKMPSGGGRAVQITRYAGTDLAVLQRSPDGEFFFYSTGYPGPESVWRLPVEGGEATKILDAVHPEALWTVGQDGICFFTNPDEKGHSDLSIYEFATGKIRKILTVDRPITYQVEVSPDGRTILYTQIDEAGSDLMLVENFR
jgi:Tol biopolymer transport system component